MELINGRIIIPRGNFMRNTQYAPLRIATRSLFCSFIVLRRIFFSLSLLRIQDTMRIIPAAPLSASRSRDVPNATESRVADPLRESAVRTVVVTLGPASRAVERPGRGGAERGALPRAASLKAYHREREKECEREGRKREGRRSGEKKK